MYFVYKDWDDFCRELSRKGYHSVTAASLLLAANNGEKTSARFINLKHDVESTPSKALDLAIIENKYGHFATYYVQAYLMTEGNKHIFDHIKALGHEVTYHHDVMDGAKGDLNKAVSIFNHNISRFEDFGFPIITVCQHGNPMSDFENRDFFKSEIVQNLYPQQADIMVDFMDKIHQKYVYISDVGMSFKIVKDPLNPISESEEPYIDLKDWKGVIRELDANPNKSYIISAHPHRYNANKAKAVLKISIFKCIRAIAKVVFKIPGAKKLLFRFNFISKKL